MFGTCFFLAFASLHLQCLCYHILNLGHVIGIQFEGLASLVVYPVPDDMRMEIWFPCRFVFWILIMPFVSVHVYLDGSDAPYLLHSIDIVQQIVHFGIRLDVYHTLTNGTAALTNSRFTILVLILHILSCMALPVFSLTNAFK